MLSMLPGPVQIAPEVRKAFLSFFECHRSAVFERVYDEVKNRLCEISGARSVQLLMGTGTLANDAVALQLTQLPGRGMILCNGEFGERLVDHAERAELAFDVVSARWGDPIELEGVRQQLSNQATSSWLWAVHCETSTGMLNDIDGLKALCKEQGIRLCLDCISTIGLLPLELHDVFLASGTSSKGLESFAGLAMVFHNHVLPGPSSPAPRYLDLHVYGSSPGAPFTTSPNLLYALRESLERLDVSRKEQYIRNLGVWFRDQLEDMGHRVLAPRNTWNPAVITVDLTGRADARALGDRLRKIGVLVNYESSYLLDRNWLQFCLMTEIHKNDVQRVIADLRSAFDASVL